MLPCAKEPMVSTQYSVAAHDHEIITILTETSARFLVVNYFIRRTVATLLTQDSTRGDGETRLSTDRDRLPDVLGCEFISISLFMVVCTNQDSWPYLLEQTAMLYNSKLYLGPISQLLHIPNQVPEGPIQDGTANAVMLMLARNSELEGAVSSVKQLEEKFNQRFHYPWVFLNDEPFTEDFKL